ncbi:autotransporter outer membrane beta-barrel domain-containing protein [Bartonella sp. WD12.1]|uniref:autotransporter outer membrane beta-barrel domain-containing protein n=1 Tax=Bartonella sp. WD12.1 TaxID=1933903 RepID=UPI00130165A3|nr:autotransporter outer membrane beta-barrel domain-containing protein [Bartonella sp. WD12.1]
MHKKSLLLSTATATIVLFSAHLNVHAANTLSATGSQDPQMVSGQKYEAKDEGGSAVSATGGGKIDGSKLTLTAKEKGKGTGASASDSGSVIELKGNTSIEQLATGLKAEKDAQIMMTGGTIVITDVAVSAASKGVVTLNDVLMTSEKQGLVATGGSHIIMNGGSIDAGKGASSDLFSNVNVRGDGSAIAVKAKDKSIITLNNVETILSDGVGLSAEGEETTITMNGGIVNAEKTAVEARNKGIINLNKVTVESGDRGLFAGKGAQIMMNGGSIDASVAVKAQYNSTVILNDAVTIKSVKRGLSASNEAQIIMNGGSITADKMAVEAVEKSVVELNNGVKITSKDKGLFADQESKITMNGGSIKATNAAVKSKGAVELNNVEVTSENAGLVAEEEAKITMNGGSITADKKTAVEAKKKSAINLNGVAITSKEKGLSAEAQEAQITMVGGKVSGKNTVYAKDGGQIALTNVAVTSNQGIGLFAEGENTKVTMNGGSVTAIAGDNPDEQDGVAFYVKEGGQIDIANVSATADKVGLELYNEQKGDNKVNFTNTKLIVKNGTGIYLNDASHDEDEGQEDLRSSEERAPKAFNNDITLKNSEIRADVLLTVTEKAKATITADHSILEGRVGTGEEGKIIFDLNNGSQWILKASKTEKGEKDQLAPIANRSRSDISILNLNDSSIVFDSPTEGHYQILQVGSGNPGTQKVYNAKGNAKLYLNAEWSDGKEIKDQKADHLLIKGDVSGSTTVYVNTQGSATEAAGFVPSNERGISLIQVSGKAEENSFKLANGYTTVSGSPYRYTLNAYGPESSKGSTSANQMLIEKDPVADDESVRNDGAKGNDFWDFRLQNQYLANSNVKALVPQMANYLVMPSVLFSTGFTDIENQNALLTDIRIAMPWEMQNEKKNPFFLSSYGSKTTLSSNRTALEYGYGADIGYAAIQTGVALAPLEWQNTSLHFGLLGTYGKLSFTPQNMADVDKTALEKWGVTAYSSVQNNNGVYFNALLSYGLLKGNVFNAVIGRTAKLDDANTWSASATLGKKLATSVEGLMFEPQVQIAYQQLLLGSIQDANNFKVDVGNPHQWAVRMGGRLTKNVNRVEDGHLFSFYGKLNLISTFGDEGTIRVGDSFHLDPMGSAIEGGIGVNAQLFQNIALHGDISYQQKLQKAGISGATLSGGLKYRF